MMTDIELLALAAKAVGAPGRFIERKPEDGYPTYSCGFGAASGPLWNPLDDDGAAQRLGVSLMIDIRHTSDEVAVMGYNGQWQHEPVAGDRGPATRRAIVRAAASYGKVMFP